MWRYHRASVVASGVGGQGPGDRPEIPRGGHHDHAQRLQDHLGRTDGGDRAALDVAIRLGLEHGGWCPRGRTAADGPLDQRYQLQETESAGYRQRTKLNVRDACATLILNEGDVSGGTALTVRLAASIGRPHVVIHLDDSPAHDNACQVRRWLLAQRVGVLNVAGPGERKRPGIYERAAAFLILILATNGT